MQIDAQQHGPSRPDAASVYDRMNAFLANSDASESEDDGEDDVSGAIGGADGGSDDAELLLGLCGGF